MAMHKPKENAVILERRFKENLEKINKRSRKKFKVSASVGIHMEDGDKLVDLHQILEKADEFLYEAKKKKKPFGK